MSQNNRIVTFSPEPNQNRSIRLGVVPCKPEQIAVLDASSAYLHDELCWHHEASQTWLELPDHLQQQLDQGEWDREIAILQTKELIQVRLEVRQ